METEKRGRRKAQVSIFMILAMLLLLGGVLWFTLIDVSEQDKTFVQVDIKPVHEFITECLHDSTKQSMQRIGETGGYIDIPMQIGTNPAAYMAYAPHIRNPYWWHDGVDAVPSIGFIQQEAERKTEQLVAECMDNLSMFRPQYALHILSDPKVSISFAEEDTSAVMRYSLSLQTANNGTLYSLSEFSTTVPIRFGKVYNLSVTLMEKANSEYFFEKKALDLMAMVPNEIPITEVDMSCETKRWQVDEVKARLQELLQRNIPFTKVKGASFSTTQYVPNPFEQGSRQTFENSYYNYHYIWDLGMEDWQGLRVGFEYDPRWPTPFTVRPSDNGAMESNAMEGTRELSMICMQIAHFTYDVQFPVRVSVVDPSAPTEPYVFSFAFENAIDKNAPSRELIGKELLEPVDDLTSTEYCAQGEHPTTVYTVINTTGDFVDGINLTFVCGRFSCPIGHSDWISYGAAAGLTKELPRCTNGIVRGQGVGYTSSEKFIAINKDDQVVFLNVFPTTEMGVRVVKHNSFTPSQEEFLSASERAIISIEAIGANFKSSTFFTQDSQDAEPPLQLLADGPHAYKLTIYLIRGDSIVGGYEGEWEADVSRGDAKVSIFHVIESGFADENDNAMFIKNLAANSKNVPRPQVG